MEHISFGRSNRDRGLVRTFMLKISTDTFFASVKQRHNNPRSGFALAAAFAFLLQACSSSAPADSSAGKAIAIWHHQTAGDGPQLIQQAVDRFKQDTPGVQIEVVAVNNDAYKT